jgi:hypothetical protein
VLANTSWHVRATLASAGNKILRIFVEILLRREFILSLLENTENTVYNVASEWVKSGHPKRKKEIERG